MNLQRTVIFSTQVWLTSVVAGPPLVILLQWFSRMDVGLLPWEIMSYYLLHLVYGSFFSIPNLLLLMFGVAVVHQLQNWSEPARRLLIQLWAFVLTVGIFMWFFHDDSGMNESMWLYILSYSAALSIGIWNFPLQDSAPETLE